MIARPVEHNSDLKDEYIKAIAEFLIAVRGEVIERHEKQLGDTPLSLGIRAYECCRTRLITQDNLNIWSWFSILTPEKRFTFKIVNTPVRFVRTEPNSLPFKKLIRSKEATKQLDLFSEQLPFAPVHWFIVIDTYYLNPADSVYFVGYSDNKEIICQWEIPLEDNITSLTEVNSALPQAVEIDEAKLKIRTKPNPDIRKNEK